MPDYRRTWHPGGTYFFTANTLRRRGCTLLTQHIDSLRSMDYLHFNPVKHGHVGRVIDWPYSTFHARVADGIYPADRAGSVSADAVYGPD